MNEPTEPKPRFGKNDTVFDAIRQIRPGAAEGELVPRHPLTRPDGDRTGPVGVDDGNPADVFARYRRVGDLVVVEGIFFKLGGGEETVPVDWFAAWEK